MQIPVKCEICKQETKTPASLTIKFWGGQQYQILICTDCASASESYHMRLVK